MVIVPRHEAWRRDYRANRYMRDLTTEDLLARAGDLMTAQLFYGPNGKISIKVDAEPLSEMERLTHVFEELAMRGISYRHRGIIEALNLPRPPQVSEARQVLAGKSFPEKILVKFGKRHHMAELLLNGRGRLSPASFYSDPSLGRARSDAEAQVAAYVHPADAHRFFWVETDDRGRRAIDVSVSYVGSTQVHLQATTDFYVYCMAATCDARMFADFDNTCVVITRPDEFVKRVQGAVSERLAGWQFFAAAVEYFDPFFSRPHQMAPHIFKHFRFSYQKEFRLLWVPPSSDVASAHSWDHIPFEIGPLTAYAELIRT